MKTCLNCNKTFKDNYKEQKFCDRSCSSSYNNKLRILSPKTKHKIKNSLIKFNTENKRIYNYVCSKCRDPFEASRRIKKGRPTNCSKCKRKVKKLNIRDVLSLKELSKRTVSKIFRRMQLGCSACGWDKCVCDLHHIVPKVRGGLDTHNNLSYLCPNCHRLVHNGQLKIFITLKDQIKDTWKKYYLG